MQAKATTMGTYKEISKCCFGRQKEQISRINRQILELKHLKYAVTSYARSKRSQIEIPHETFDSIRRS